ncbi:SSI family serine proteinase inhibitor [Actinomadura sp. 9N215]|uniref:SSI family serine proteinase inhibitor n=1 Tax=Actinomadura sp. 9N215 TaxID=3375150 RepID=UPI0037AD1414
MHMSRARFRWAAALAGIAVVAQAAPAQASPGPAREPVGAYLLTVAPEHGHGTAKRLLCDPDGGTHPAAAEACDQLASVDGEVARIAARPGPCTMEYAPVRVSADGTWRGKPRRFAETYPNRCAAVRETGGVLFR